MDEIEKSKLALEQLEAAYAAKVEAKIAAGELRVVGRGEAGEDCVVVGFEDEIEEALEKAKAAAIEKYGQVPPLYFDFLVIVTGVPRNRDRYDPANALPARHRTGPVYPEKDEVPIPRVTEDDVPTYCAPAQDEAHISLVLDHGDDEGNLGTIAAGWFSVENGAVVLEGLDRKRLGSQVLREGQDPAVVAKQLLRKSLGDNSDFTAPIRYPRRGIA